jgi:hypothetical protein
MYDATFGLYFLNHRVKIVIALLISKQQTQAECIVVKTKQIRRHELESALCVEVAANARLSVEWVSSADFSRIQS